MIGSYIYIDQNNGCHASTTVCYLCRHNFEYRTVEKLSHPYALPKITADSRLIDAFSLPCWPLTLRRPMVLFKGAMGLAPGVPQTPNVDFMIKLVTRYPSHQAMLRKAAGSQYKNLENLLRGRHQITERTLEDLANRLKTGSNYLRSLAHGRKNGPLLPEVLLPFQIAEGLFFRTYNNLVDAEIPCLHCGGANLIDDTDTWWPNQSLGLAAPEYYFVERLLGAMTGLTVLACFLSDQDKQHESVFRVLELAEPSSSPIGNWLVFVRDAYDCKDFISLEQKLAAHGCNCPDDGQNITQPRLLKWSSAIEELMPLESGECMIARLPDQQLLQVELIISRVLALAQDFLHAAAGGEIPPDRQQIREIVYSRLIAHRTNLWLRTHAKSSKVVQGMSGGGMPGSTGTVLPRLR